MKSNVLKKIFATAMTVAVTVGTLAGCGGDTNKESANANTSTVVESSKVEETAVSEEKEAVELIMLMYQNEGMVNALDVVNEKFTEKYPWITVKLEVVENSQYKELCNTRLATGEVDLLNALMDLELPSWVIGKDKSANAERAEAGLYMDLTGEAFLENYDKDVIDKTCTLGGKVYTIPAAYAPTSGVFYNKAIFEQYNLTEPKTWDEFINICDTLKSNGIAPMTSGVKDAWPPVMAWNAVVTSEEPDGLAFVKALWDGERAFNDDETMKIWKKLENMSQYYEENVAAVDYNTVVSRFVGGKAAMMTDATWTAPSIIAADPNFEFGYFGIPGDEAPADGGEVQLVGKYDHGFTGYGKTEHKEEVLLWLEFFSEKEIYEEYINSIGMLPTRSDVAMEDEFMASLLPKIKTQGFHFEKVLYRPSGVGQYATFAALTNLPAFGGSIETVEELADLAQKDWEEAMSKIKAQ